MPDNSGLDDFGSQVHDRADNSRRIDTVSDYSARIDALQIEAGVLSGGDLEIPPRNPVLGADDSCAGTQKRSDMRSKLSQAMRFHAEDDCIDSPCLGSSC